MHGHVHFTDDPLLVSDSLGGLVCLYYYYCTNIYSGVLCCMMNMHACIDYIWVSDPVLAITQQVGRGLVSRWDVVRCEGDKLLANPVTLWVWAEHTLGQPVRRMYVCMCIV